MPRRLRLNNWRAAAICAVIYGTTWGLAAQSVTPEVVSISAAGCLVREADYAARYGLSRGRETSPDGLGQLVLVMAERGSTTGVASSSGSATAHVATAYVVTGVRERDLVAHAGKRVDLSGVVEARMPRPTTGTVTQTPTGAVGVTPDGSPAHEPGDAAPGTATPDDGTAPGSPVAIRDLPRFNVSTIRLIDQACGLPASAVAPEAPRSTSVAAATRVPVSANDPATWPRLTVVGCVVREADPVRPLDTVLALRKATVRPPAGARPGQGAVPGSLPSGSGSGTVGSSAVDSRSQAEEQGFALTGYDATLADHVDRRVEVTGLLAPANAVSIGQPAIAGTRSDVSPVTAAHQSAPQRQLRVQSFRPIGSGCAR